MKVGACANLNPPAENVAFAQVKAWGEQVAETVAPRLLREPPAVGKFRGMAHIVPLPRDVLDAEGINAFAKKALQDKRALAEWDDKYRRVVAHWRSSLAAG
jgi:hypothetical protein